MKRFVVGFLFSPDKNEVVLIQKTRPDWQKGQWNGVGGHVNEDEDYMEAMIREFYEETGVTINNWNLFHTATNYNNDVKVLFYRAFDNKFKDVVTTTDEFVDIMKIHTLKLFPLIYNLSWLIPLALDNKTSKSVSTFALLNNSIQP